MSENEIISVGHIDKKHVVQLVVARNSRSKGKPFRSDLRTFELGAEKRERP